MATQQLLLHDGWWVCGFLALLSAALLWPHVHHPLTIVFNQRLCTALALGPAPPSVYLLHTLYIFATLSTQSPPPIFRFPSASSSGRQHNFFMHFWFFVHSFQWLTICGHRARCVVFSKDP